MKIKVPYDLDRYAVLYQSIIDAGFCEETGLPFDMDASRGPYTPSLDRIIPELGYVHGNVRVVVWGLNCGFGNFGEEIYLHIAKAFIQSRNKSSSV